MSNQRISGIGSLLPARAIGKKWWQKLFIYPTFLGALLGAIPTGIDLYKSVQYDIGFSDVKHAEEQRRLWIKNFDCTQNMSYQQVKTKEEIAVQVGACPNGDVLIEVAAPQSDRILEWISLQRLRSEASLSWLSPIGTAHAALWNQRGVGVSPTAFTRTAQGSADIVCQTMKDQTKIVRIVRENGICYREEIEVLKGKIANRTQVSCSTTCS